MKVQRHDSRNNENVDEGRSYNNSWYNKKWWLTCEKWKHKCDLTKVEDRKIIYPRGRGWKVLRQNIAIQFPFQRLRVFDEWRWPNKTTSFMPIESHLEMHMWWINENMHFAHPHIVRTQVHTKYHLTLFYVQLEWHSIFLLTYLFSYLLTHLHGPT